MVNIGGMGMGMEQVNKFVPYGFYYFSKSQIKAAILQANQAKKIETDGFEQENLRFCGGLETNDQTAYVISAIILAFSFLESFINEIFTSVKYSVESNTLDCIINNLSMNEREKIVYLWDNHKISTLDKYELLLNQTKNKTFNKGDTLYQNVSILSKLRNYFVHYKPERIYHDDSIQSIGKHLKGKFALNPFAHKGSPYFPDKCISYGCAMWAIDTVLNFTNDFAKKINWDSYSDQTIDSILERK